MACSWFLFSCYTPRYVYSPAAHNVPVLDKKGDSKLAANYSASTGDNNSGQNTINGKATGFDLQAAYAFTNHWALQINYFNRTERNSGDFTLQQQDSVVINYKRYLTEVAAGYFHTLDDKGRIMFQVFGGAGFGTSSFTDNGRDFNGIYRSRFHKMNITKVFIQPVLLVKSKGTFTASLSSRYSIISFKNISTNYSATELNNYVLDSLTYRPRLFWEPATVYSFGYKKLPGIKIEFQMGLAILMSRQFVDYRTFNFSTGLLFDLPKLLTNTRHSSKN
jgi:hypothetical protein